MIEDFVEFAIPRIIGALLAIWMGASMCKADPLTIAPVRPIEKPSPQRLNNSTSQPLIVWTKPVRPSIQIQGRKGVPPAQYNLNDLSFDGDLTNARSFFKTHEAIFWLKGSLEFSYFKPPWPRKTFAPDPDVDLARK